MCEYCKFDETNLAEKPLYMNGHGEVVFMEKVDNQYQIASSRVNTDLPYISFEIDHCPKCGRNLKEKSPAARLLDILGGEF